MKEVEKNWKYEVADLGFKTAVRPGGGTALTNPSLKVKRLTKTAKLPERAYEGDSGLDVFANIANEIKIGPGERLCVRTGLSVEVPYGYEVQVRPKSGMAFKYGITVLNTPGTIDHGFVGEIQVILINHSSLSYWVQPEQKIAQLVIAPVCMWNVEEVEELDSTERGSGGFGSTGV